MMMAILRWRMGEFSGWSRKDTGGRCRLVVGWVGFGLGCLWMGCGAKPGQVVVSPNGPERSPAAVTNTVQATNVSAGSVSAGADSFDHAGEAGLTDDDIAQKLSARGGLHLEAGRLAEAAHDYRHALVHDAEGPDIHYNLGIILGRLGDIPGAMRHYEEALRLLPDYAEVHNNLGNLLVKVGRLEDALRHFQQALEINPDGAMAFNNVGIALARLDRLAEASTNFLQALTLAPDYVDARFNLGALYERQKRWAEAREQYEGVLRIRPGHEQSLRGLARIALGMRQAGGP